MCGLEQVLNVLAAGVKHYFTLGCGLGNTRLDSRICFPGYSEKPGWLWDSSEVLPRPLELGEISSQNLLEVI